jgi:hypothetical protein
MIDQDQHRMNTNPYHPTLSGTTQPLKGIRWFRRFAILNSVILLVPAVCALAAYLVLSANGIWLSGVSGVTGTLAILLIAYLAIPNSIMVALWIISRRSSRQQNSGN